MLQRDSALVGMLRPNKYCPLQKLQPADDGVLQIKLPTDFCKNVFGCV